MDKHNIAILGNINENYEPHFMMNNRLIDLQQTMPFDFEWIPTENLCENAATVLSKYTGIIAGSGPYKSKEGVINGIRHARLNNIPFLGTCSGFGYAVLEFGQAVFGLATVRHPREDAGLPLNETFLQELNLCGIGMHTITFAPVPGTLASRVYNNQQAVTEWTHCSYGIHSGAVGIFEKEGLVASAYDADGEIKMMEYNRNDFFVITLFLPQLNRETQPHPLMLAYLNAVKTKVDKL